MEEELEGALDEEGVILVIPTAEEYQEVNQEIIHHLVQEKDLNGIYTTVNEPYRTVKNFLQEGGIDTENIFFVDAVSMDIGAEEVERENVMYLESPQHLTDISIVMSESIGKLPEGEKFLFFDSMSTLTIYNNITTVAKFAHFLTGKIRNWNVTGVIISIESEADEQVINRLKQFADRVIEL